jgi:hypothetical protein
MPLGLVAFERRVILKNSFFWQAFTGVCRYRIFPVASKPQARKRCEFFSMVYPHKYLWFQASYAPAADDFERRVILDAGYKNSAFQLKNSCFGKHLKTVNEPAPICSANCISHLFVIPIL